jgi:hypothetical protein
MKMFSKLFWKDTFERAIRAGAWSVLTALGLSSATPVNAFEIDPQLAFGFFAGGAILSSLFSLASGAVTTQTISPASVVKVTPPEQPAEPA